MKYPYNQRNLLDRPENYHYAECSNSNFLNEWSSSRQEYASRIVSYMHTMNPSQQQSDLSKEKMSTHYILNSIKASMVSTDQDSFNSLHFFMRRFEVTKKLYENYEKGTTIPCTDASFRNPELYILLAECLERAYINTGNTQYLSTLLKVMDTLTSLDVIIYSHEQSLRILDLINRESDHIQDLSI